MFFTIGELNPNSLATWARLKSFIAIVLLTWFVSWLFLVTTSVAGLLISFKKFNTTCSWSSSSLTSSSSIITAFFVADVCLTAVSFSSFGLGVGLAALNMSANPPASPFSSSCLALSIFSSSSLLSLCSLLILTNSKIFFAALFAMKNSYTPISCAFSASESSSITTSTSFSFIAALSLFFLAFSLAISSNSW